ncbi:MAG TPA: hypothetical protein VD766_04095, partial [Solirubrobacterales bacterium]|nr:hypothetical protein [Solirubrobacterales bacterium]
MRSATAQRLVAAVLAAGAIAFAWALPDAASAKTTAGTGEPVAIYLVVLPIGTEPTDLADAGLSPGALSPGLSTVPPDQTFLDITQGNRVHEALYDGDLP